MDPAGRRAYFMIQSRNLPLRDRDWAHIFQELEEHEEAFERYYPAFMMQTNYEDQIRLVTAFALNDELYNYIRERVTVKEGVNPQILEAMATQADISVSQMAVHLDVPYKTVQKAVVGLKKIGVVERIGEREKGYWKIKEEV